MCHGLMLLCVMMCDDSIERQMKVEVIVAIDVIYSLKISSHFRTISQKVVKNSLLDVLIKSIQIRCGSVSKPTRYVICSII